MLKSTPFALALASAALHAALAGPPNLIVNGDFETATLAGINSDYLHTPQGNTDEGTWWVNPWDPGGPWFGTQHTPGGAAAMSVNGDDSTQAGVKRVWHQVVQVEPGQTYTYSLWALATAAGVSGYSLRLAVDGEPISGVISPTAAFLWEPHSVELIAKGTTIEVSIVNVSGITFPNDFMLDDISVALAGLLGDLNGDGEVDGADIALILGQWGNSGVPEDLNGDGVVDGADLAIVLGNWTG